MPECKSEKLINKVCNDLGLEVMNTTTLSPWSHTFSHYQLNVSPKQIEVKDANTMIADAVNYEWVNISEPGSRGLSASVKKITPILSE